MKVCKSSKKYLIRQKTNRVGADDNYFEVDHLAMKNFPTITIKTLEARSPNEAACYLRFTNPNVSRCVIKLSQLSESQAEKINMNCSIEMPENEIQIDFLNELIDSGAIDTSIDVGKGKHSYF